MTTRKRSTHRWCAVELVCFFLIIRIVARDVESIVAEPPVLDKKRQVALTEQLFALMDHYFRNEQWLRTKPDNWTEGGVMPDVRRGMLLTSGGRGGQWVAHSVVSNQLARGSKLSFVYDFVADAAGFDAMKYVLDAARGPLREDLDEDEFAALYGIPRYLRFKPASTRKVRQYDIWADIYA